MSEVGKLSKREGKVSKEARAAVWYAACNIAQKSISLITVPIFTRIMTTADYGLNNVFNSWMSLIVIFATLNLQGGTFNTAMVEFEDDRDAYVSSMQGLVTTITTLLFALYAAFSEQIDGITGLSFALMAAMAVQMVTTVAFGLWSGRKRFEYEYKSVVVLTLISTVLTPLVGVLMVLSVETGRGEMRIYSVVLVQLVLFGAVYAYNLVKGRTFLRAKYWKFALGMNLALIPYYLAQMLFSSSDLLMINWLCGTGDAGLYGVAYSLGMVLTFVLSSINGSYVPWKYEKIKRGDMQGIGALTSKIGLFLMLALALLMLFAPEIVGLLAAEQYYDARWVVPPVAASMFFLFFVQQFVDVEFLMKDRLALVLGSAVAAVANIVLNYLLIPVFGYIVAGFTTLASYILFVAFNYLTCRASLKNLKPGYGIPDFCDMKPMLLLSAAMVSIAVAAEFLYCSDLARYLVIAVSATTAIALRKRIVQLCKQVLSR